MKIYHNGVTKPSLIKGRKTQKGHKGVLKTNKVRHIVSLPGGILLAIATTLFVVHRQLRAAWSKWE